MCTNVVSISQDEAHEFAKAIVNHPEIEFPEIPAIYREAARTFVLAYKTEECGSIEAVIWGLILPGKVKVEGVTPMASADIHNLLYREVLYHARQMGAECIWDVPRIKAPKISAEDASFPPENMEKLNKILGCGISF